MGQDNQIIEVTNEFGFIHGENEPRYHTIWNLISLKDVISKNLPEMILYALNKTYKCRHLFVNFLQFDKCNLNEHNYEKLYHIKKFLTQSEHAYVIRHEKLKEEFFKM